MECIATCGFGMEAPLKDELINLGLTIKCVEDGKVRFFADQYEIVKANLWTRCADRIFIEYASFKAETFTQLFDGIRVMPWKEILPKDAAITVTAKSALSKLFSVRDIQAISKKAIADSMIDIYKSCTETGEKYNIEIGLLRDVASITLNTSGAGLNRRGYRDLSVQAPLRETLGATLVYLSQYNGTETLIDPCCGSGTIAIEAAMIASNTAPGLIREFAFDGWEHYKIFAEKARDEALQAKIISGFPHIQASDIDPNAVSIARRHAKRAGVNGFINFTVYDVAEISVPDKGVIVTNPPYGIRLEKSNSVIKALARIKSEKPGVSVNVISQDEDFEKLFGRKADKKRKLYNGGVKCNYYMYFRKRKDTN